MVKSEILILIPEGLHARAANAFLNHIKGSKSKIIFKYKNQEANARSMLSLLALHVRFNRKIMVEVTGDDEKEVMQKIEHFFSISC